MNGVSNEFPDSYVVQIFRDEMVDPEEEGEEGEDTGMTRTRMSECNDVEQEEDEKHARRRPAMSGTGMSTVDRDHPQRDLTMDFRLT